MADRLYDENLYRFAEPEPSYWEATVDAPPPATEPLSGDADCDVAIIGGGYTGLSSAYHLARDHAIEARVLDAGHIGWGASGRNGGFCTVGGCAAGDRTLLSRHGLGEVRRYYQSQVDAVERVRSIIADEKIDAGMTGDSELELAHSKRAWRALEAHCNWQRDKLGLDVRPVSADVFRARYFNSRELHGAVRLRPSFGLHPLRYLRGLADATALRGVKLHDHSEVLDWTRRDNRHVLRTAGGSLRADYVIVAANGFMPEHLHPLLSARVLPVISAIIVTRELSADELDRYAWRTENPAINSRALLNYFRLLPDRRLLFGGRGHATGSAADCQRQKARLAQQMARAWPDWAGVNVEFSWQGLIAMTRRLTPALARSPDDPTVYLAFGYHGNGVNTATWSGQQLAAWLATDGRSGTTFDHRLPAIVRGLPERFPLPSLRLRYLRAALAVLRIRDSLS